MAVAIRDRFRLPWHIVAKRDREPVPILCGTEPPARVKTICKHLLAIGCRDARQIVASVVAIPRGISSTIRETHKITACIVGVKENLPIQVSNAGYSALSIAEE